MFSYKVPNFQIEGDALIVIPEPGSPREGTPGRVPFMAEIVNQIKAMGMVVTESTNVPDALAGLRARRFDLVMAEWAMPEKRRLLSEVGRQRRLKQIDTGIFFFLPHSDMDVYLHELDEDALACPWTSLGWPWNPVELQQMMRRMKMPQESKEIEP